MRSIIQHERRIVIIMHRANNNNVTLSFRLKLLAIMGVACSQNRIANDATKDSIIIDTSRAMMTHSFTIHTSKSSR